MPRPATGAMEKSTSIMRRKPIRSGTPTRTNANREPSGQTTDAAITFPKKRTRQDDGAGALKLVEASSQPARRSRKQQRKQLRKNKRQKTNDGTPAADGSADDDNDDDEADADADADADGDADASDADTAKATVAPAGAWAVLANGGDDDDADAVTGSEALTWQGEDLNGRVPETKKPAPRPVQGIDIPIATAAATAALTATATATGKARKAKATAAPGDFVAAAATATAGGPTVGVLSDVESAELRRTLAIHTVMTPATLPLPPVVNAFASPLLPPVFGQYMSGRSGGAGRFTAPSAVQCQAWPAILMGYDVIAQAGTGSGKTLTYLLPAIVHIHKHQTPADTKQRLPIALALLPTRELAVQVLAITKHFEKPFRIISVGLYGGARRDDQWDVLTSRHVQLVVATPGRLLDFVKAKQVVLRRVSYVVLDEADRMLSMGFQKELNACIEATAPPADRQLLCFSATYPHSVESALAQWFTRTKPSVRIVIGTPPAATVGGAVSSLTLTGALAAGATAAVGAAGAAGAADGASAAASASAGVATANGLNGLLMVSPSISQIVQCCAAHKKPRKLLKFLTDLKQREDRERMRHRTSVLVFVNKIKTVRELEMLIKKHQNDVYTAQGLHSQKTQSERDRVMRDFKNGKIPILIATDVAGRGIDMKQLRVIINFDFPSTLQQYVHRCGRTARAPISTADKPAEAAPAPTKASKAALPPPGIPHVPEWGSGRGLAFSFFTRNRALLAADLIAILRANAQYVDPNLTALAEEVARELPPSLGGTAGLPAPTATGTAAAGGAANADADDDAADGDDDEETWKKPTAAVAAAAKKPAAPAASAPVTTPKKPAHAQATAKSGAATVKAAAPKPAAAPAPTPKTAVAKPAAKAAKPAKQVAAPPAAADDDDDDEDDAAVGAWTAQARAIPGSKIVIPPRNPNAAADSDDDDEDL